MSIEPAERHASVADFGRELQLAQRHNGLHAGSDGAQRARRPAGADGRARERCRRRSRPAGPVRLEADSISAGGSTGSLPPPTPNMFAHTASVSQSSLKWPVQSRRPIPGRRRSNPRRRDRKKILIASAAAAAALLLVVGGILHRHSRATPAVAKPPRVNRRPPRKRSRLGSRSPTRALPATGWRPPRPTAPSGFSAAWGRITASADNTRATTPPSTAGRAARTYPFRCSMRCR